MRAALLALSLALAAPAHAEKLVLLVRHAEKADDQAKDPPLSEAGKQRAEALRALLAKTGVTHVFTSELQRTRQTAAPLASFLKIAPVVVPAKDADALVAKIKALPADAVVLVVGHSNTLPALVQKLGSTAPVIADDEYGRVFVVVKQPTGAPTLVELAY